MSCDRYLPIVDYHVDKQIRKGWSAFHEGEKREDGPACINEFGAYRSLGAAWLLGWLIAEKGESLDD